MTEERKRIGVHEYAGFSYDVYLTESGSKIVLEPVPGQHRAAGKERHVRAALETYLEENRL